MLRNPSACSSDFRRGRQDKSRSAVFQQTKVCFHSYAKPETSHSYELFKSFAYY
jgi:hypothetical protein